MKQPKTTPDSRNEYERFADLHYQAHLMVPLIPAHDEDPDCLLARARALQVSRVYSELVDQECGIGIREEGVLV